MKTRCLWPLVMVITCGCATDGIQVHKEAHPVARHTNWKKWKRFQPEQTVEFGQWRIHAPEKKSTGAKSSVVLGPYNREKHRMESDVAFQLERSGTAVATVAATANYNVKSTSPPIIGGRINSDERDEFVGQIQLASGPPCEFQLTGFSSDRNNIKASGLISVGHQQFTMQEVEAPWHDSRDGLAGVDFFADGRRVGQVIRGQDAVIGGSNKESVWIDPQLPESAQTAIAAMSGALLVTDRLKPAPPPADD